MPRRRSARQRRTASRRTLVVFLVALAGGALLTMWLWDWFSSPDIVARVLFCETANCTPAERLLVAGLMKNRIGHPAFGNSSSLRDVVEQPGAFSCVGDDDNGNWAKTRHLSSLTAVEQRIWRECLVLANEDIPAAVGPSGRPLVFYHDRSIHKPKSWDGDTWHAVPELTTAHFVFYSIVPARN